MIDVISLFNERLILLIFPLSFLLLFIDKQEVRHVNIKIYTWIKKFLNFILESNVENLMLETKLLVSVHLFQMIRISTVLLCVFMVTMITQSINYSFLIITILVYKSFYIYLCYLSYQSRNKIKKQLPYFLKCIIYLCYIYPVPNALNRAVELVPEIFKEKLLKMNKMIDSNPNSFMPYEWLNKQLFTPSANFMMYLRIIYRMSQSGGSEHQNLLSNINQGVSDELNIIRKRKNKTINDTIQYLGLIPVIMVTFMLGYLLIKVSEIL